jgi:hypothetical protein
MKIFFLYSFFHFFILMSCSIIPNANIEVKYYEHPVRNSSRISVYFTGGFDDSLLIMQNKLIVSKEIFVSDWSTDYTGVVKVLELKRGKNLEIVELSTKKKIKIKLLKGYKIIEISKYSNKWMILYTNRPIVFE